MMRVNGVVTLFSPDDEGERFARKGEFPAWIYHKELLRNTEKGVYKRDNFDVRIARECLDKVEIGDMIFFGSLADEEFEVCKCSRISAVSENNVGVNAHWHLQAEYEYR